MKKFFLAGLLSVSAIWLSAEVIDVNGTFKLDDKGNAIGWTVDNNPKNPGKVEFTKTTYNTHHVRCSNNNVEI